MSALVNTLDHDPPGSPAAAAPPRYDTAPPADADDTAPEGGLPEDADEPDEGKRDTDDVGTMRMTAGFAAVGGVVLAAIGFTGSYNTLRELARSKGFGDFSYAFPVGIDCGILVLLALDLYMMRKRMPLPMLRWTAHALTAATVAFNAAAPPGPVSADPLAAAMHGVIPLLFIAAVEAARHYVGRMSELLAGVTPLGSVPLARWFLAPLSTPRLARRMRLYNLPYTVVAAQHQQLKIYREQLRQRYGQAWKSLATPNEMLPFKMARFGFSVEQALGVPLLEEAKQRRREADAAFQRAEAEIQKVGAELQIRTAQIQAEVDKIRAEGQLKLARTEAENAAKAEIQRAEAAFQRADAERKADVLLVQEAAQARVQELADEAEKRRAQARIDAEKAQVDWAMEQQRLQSEAIAEQERLEAEATERAARTDAARRVEQARRERELAEQEEARLNALQAAAERRAAEAEQRAREMKAAQAEQAAREEAAASQAREAALVEAAAERRARAAEYEARAVENAARARMGQADWDAHRVAAMIRARGADAVTVKAIEEELGVSAGTAHDRKQRALQFLAQTGDPVADAA